MCRAVICILLVTKAVDFLDAKERNRISGLGFATEMCSQFHQPTYTCVLCDSRVANAKKLSDLVTESYDVGGVDPFELMLDGVNDWLEIDTDRSY